ncbi:hypothetical protein AncyloWKF20_15905 [Ancylobacter sp. WKF20]|uniref:hypothetical protein n=1 Tax=Ancylobacter sp. WKF20 TaxID=3039801 RepID=UPI00243446A9|nr:hypothetical protein [Ancylobacter sp. WKF20]WGD29249.1 hypothetical protein AncyloWKF20_15905 [Ancylobacter sp. WKF20]
MMGLAGLVGAGATLGLALTPARATPLSQLKDIEAGAAPADAIGPDADILDVVAEAPDGTPIDQAQWGPPGPPGPPRGRPPGPPPGYYRRRRRRRERVCGWRRDRWGRRYRDCWYVWR